jgi:hypothetical protein
VTTLSHLSPDVLEVVRDVAKQEDSFLLRAQGVPIHDFISGRAVPIRPSAAGLSKAERHLLAYGREELAFATESALYAVVTSQARSNAITPRAVTGEFDGIDECLRYFKRDAGTTGSLFQAEAISRTLFEVAERKSNVSWRVLARQAMALRTRVPTIINVTLGYVMSGESEQTAQALQRLTLALRNPHVDGARVQGLALFNGGHTSAAADSYAQAWRMSGNIEDAACSILNAWMATSPVAADVASAWARIDDQQHKACAAWLRAAVCSPMNQAGRSELVRQLKGSRSSVRAHFGDRLVEELGR